MEEVYDTGQFTYFVVIYIQETKVYFKCFSTIQKGYANARVSAKKDACITYDKQKMKIKSWGEKYSESNDWDKRSVEDEDEEDKYDYDEGDICIDNFRDELNRVFKKDKEEWNEDDLFLLKAVPDFIRLSVEDLERKLKSTDQLHYLFVVPTEWKEEIKETLLRPILIQSNLISKNDHNDRLLFCSDLESIFYGFMEENDLDFKKIRKTILCRFLCPVSEDEILIKLDLVSTVNRLFDFPKSLLYPKVEHSNSISLTTDTFTGGIRAFINDKLPFDIQEEIVQIIMDNRYGEDEEYEKYEEYEEDEEDKENFLKKPLITDTSRWKLDKRQQDFIRHICISDICSQIRDNMTNNIDDLLSNDIIKEYTFFPCIDLFSSEISPNRNLLNWSQYLLAYNGTHSRNENIRCLHFGLEIDSDYIMDGASQYYHDIINNANIYGRPQILPVKNSANSLSIFLESKPDAIMNIDISIESTILSFSLLDENGFVKEIWNHNDFLKDKSLRSLGSFFDFSETTTLNVKFSFIEFTKNYFMNDISFLYGDKNNDFLQFNATKIETILCKDSYSEDLLVSTQQQIYIKAMETKIGYNTTIEKILQDRLFDTEEGLRDIIYASGLIQKDDDSKKLRIITQGERTMYLLQRSLALSFSLKSYFVLAQLHESYIQLTLNQVVTESSSDEDDQEAIIIHDRIVHIPNIYTSLCSNMWNNIIENSNLIKLCDRHQKYSGNDFLDIFSLKNQLNSQKSLNSKYLKISSQPATDKINIQLSVSCNCRVYLTIRDIIDVSFRPVLQDIASLVSASFINKELFGKFWNIHYFFQLIQFDYNTLLHNSLIKMLKETTEDVIIEQGVDIPHYVIPKSLNKILLPVLHQRSISYKEFRAGTLRQVHGDGYGFGFINDFTYKWLVYNNEATNIKTVSVSEETVFPLFKKEDLINDLPKNHTVYLSPQEEVYRIDFRINYLKLKTPYNLNSDGTVRFDDIQEDIGGPNFNGRRRDLKIGQDLPISISVLYEAYSGFINLKVKLVGQDISTNRSQRIGAPMHLSRF